MKAFHTFAEVVPPKTSADPEPKSNESVAFSRLSPTATESCGVYPTNQAETASDEVPVLPATGRPSSRAALLPPPLVTTCCMA